MSGLKPEFQVIEESDEDRAAAGRDAFRDPFPADYAIGVVLRDARMRRKAGLEKVAAALRIRLDYLQAIEEGDSDSLPGQAYAVGFVRSYAVWLGLDGEEAVRRFKEETGGFPSRRPLPAPMGEPAPGAAPRNLVAVIVLALIVGAGIGIWYFLYGAAGPQVSAGEAPASGTSAGEATAGEATAEPAAAVTPATETPVATVATVAPAATGQAEDADAAAADAVDGGDTADTDTAADTDAEGAVPALAPRVVLSVVADSWIQIRDPEGNVLMTRLMRPGEEFPVDPALEGLSLLVGDPSIVRFMVDGAMLPPLDIDRAAGDGIPLDAERLIETVGGSG